MLTKIYIDNILCFTNFELHLSPFTVLLGGNGSGKTSILELVDRVRQFVIEGIDVDTFAPSETLTRWDNRDEQKVGLAVTLDGEQFEYEVVIKHTPDRDKRRVMSERLTSDGDKLFEFDDQAVVHLYNDHGEEKHAMPFDWSQSSLGRMQERRENTRLVRFRRWLKDIQLARPDPRHVSSRSERSKSSMAPDLSDFAAWLRGHFETSPKGPGDLDAQLRQVLDGFDTLHNEDLGKNQRQLQARFRPPKSKAKSGKPVSLGFEELSDGQRQLVMLYALVILELDPGKSLLVDEPDNFLALREIQPWLNLLQDHRDEHGGQVILSSHHPDVLNQMAIDHGTWLWRDSGGPVRARPFQEIADRFDKAITSSEIVARGWEEA